MIQCHNNLKQQNPAVTHKRLHHILALCVAHKPGRTLAYLSIIIWRDPAAKGSTMIRAHKKNLNDKQALGTEHSLHLQEIKGNQKRTLAPRFAFIGAFFLFLLILTSRATHCACAASPRSGFGGGSQPCSSSDLRDFNQTTHDVYIKD